MLRILMVAFWALGFTYAAYSQAASSPYEPRAMSAMDMVELTRLSSPNVSPDGRYLLYKRSRTSWDENKIIRRYVLLDLETGEELAAPNPEKEDRSANDAWWAPDSRSILFTRGLKRNKTDQLFQYDLKTGAIRQLTNHGSSIDDIAISPDGTELLFTTAVQEPHVEKHQKKDGWLIDAYDSPQNRELWRLDSETKMAEPILFGDYSIRDVSLSDDGQSLVYSKTPDHRRKTRHLSEVYTQSLDGEEPVRWTHNDYRENSVKLSSDGSKIAFIADVNEEGEPYYEDKVFVQVKGKPPQRLLSDLPMEAIAFEWDAAGSGIYLLGNTGLSTDLYHLNLVSRNLRQLTEGDHNVATWSYDRESDTHVARIESQFGPGEFYIMRPENAVFTPITQEYSDWAKMYKLPRQEAVSWRGGDDVKIEGLLVYPVNYDPSVRYPLVTITHGGPRSSSSFGSWNISRYVAVLAGQGYMILLPNHLGGTGYGDSFVRDMYGGYFQNAHHDVMDGIDALIERGLVDPERLIKMGWSAGGHMVNKLITHTDRFKAASSGAGASDWLSMHGESDVRRSRSFVFGGMPCAQDAPLAQYEADSPLRQAWKVTTPTLFFVGENDVRVPPTQSILMHRGVAATGTPTHLYQAAGEPHNYRKPSHQLFKINTELAWYAEHLQGVEYEPVMPDAAFDVRDQEDDVKDESQEAITSFAQESQ